MASNYNVILEEILQRIRRDIFSLCMLKAHQLNKTEFSSDVIKPLLQNSRPLTFDSSFEDLMQEVERQPSLPQAQKATPNKATIPPPQNQSVPFPDFLLPTTSNDTAQSYFPDIQLPYDPPQKRQSNQKIVQSPPPKRQRLLTPPQPDSNVIEQSDEETKTEENKTEETKHDAHIPEEIRKEYQSLKDLLERVPEIPQNSDNSPHPFNSYEKILQSGLNICLKATKEFIRSMMELHNDAAEQYAQLNSDCKGICFKHVDLVLSNGRRAARKKNQKLKDSL